MVIYLGRTYTCVQVDTAVVGRILQQIGKLVGRKFSIDRMLRIDVVTLPINFCISSMSSSYYNFLVLSVCHLVDYSRAIFNLEKIVEKDWKYSISESLPADLIFFLLYFYLNDSERNLFCAFVIKQSYKGSIVNRTSLSIKQKS